MALHKNPSPTLYKLQFGRQIIEGICALVTCHKNTHSTACTAKFTPSKKCHCHRRGQVDFKNVPPMLHEKHKKMCFSRSMGSTFSTFATPPQRNDHLFVGIITAEGCQKWQKKVPPTEHEKHIFDVCNPSRLIMTFLAGHARLKPV